MRSALEGLLRRYCPCDQGVYHSMCVPELNEAMYALAVEGWFVVMEDEKGRVKGRLVTDRHEMAVRVPGITRVRPANRQMVTDSEQDAECPD